MRPDTRKQPGIGRYMNLFLNKNIRSSRCETDREENEELEKEGLY